MFMRKKFNAYIRADPFFFLSRQRLERQKTKQRKTFNNIKCEILIWGEKIEK